MVETTEPFDYKRAITHYEYPHKDKKTKKGGFSRMLSMQITHNKKQWNTEALDDSLPCNDKL